jgi:hypothetical protein
MEEQDISRNPNNLKTLKNNISQLRGKLLLEEDLLQVFQSKEEEHPQVNHLIILIMMTEFQTR